MTTVAVVDLDGTLVPGNSFHGWMKALTRWALRTGRLHVAALVVGAAALRLTRVIDHTRMKRIVLHAGRSAPATVAERFGQALAATARPIVLDRAEAHIAAGHRIVLASAAPEHYLGGVAGRLGADAVLATPALVGPGWTELVGVRKLEALVARYGSDVVIDTVYSDHADDLPLLRRAVNAVAVAPSERQAKAMADAGLAPMRLLESAGPDGEPGVGAVIVTYNSAAVLGRAVDALLAGTVIPRPIVIVDNASTDTTYLDAAEAASPDVVTVRLDHNAGFCVANNLGTQRVGAGRHVLYLNPDAFVSEGFVADALAVLAAEPRVGAVGPKLLGADAATGQPTGRVDSAGIVQRRSGRLADRGQGEPDGPAFDDDHGIVALCAAAVLCRRDALAEVAPDGDVFDESFFMYKEDIDLSFRLRKAGWDLRYDAALTVHHCRGWQQNRQAMPRWARDRSLRNEWRLWRKGFPDRSRLGLLPYLLSKTIAVRLGR